MPSNFSSIGFDLAVRSSSKQPRRLEAGERFTVVVLGDFSGRTSRGVMEPLHPNRLRQVDVDTYARVFAQVGARLQLSGAAFPGGTLELAFASMGDWHPDRLLAQIPWLACLIEARALLLNPATAERGRAALEACLGQAKAVPTESPATAAAPETDEDTFARLMGGDLPPRTVPAPASGLNALIQQAIAPHVTAAPAAWQSGALAAAEMELIHRLRSILQHPDFQALEAAWRGVDMLIHRIESDEEISLLVLDASLAELQADLAAQPQAEECVLFRLLRDRHPGLLVGNFTFSETAEDLRTLGVLAQVAAGLSAALVASAAPALVGCDSFARHPDPDDWTFGLNEEAASVWAALREARQASHVGLTSPRFLARLPYGKVGNPIDTFTFEELPADPPHEAFLWGHSGILIACSVIDAIQSGDTHLAEFTGGEIGEMPIHLFTEDGEKVVKCHAEAWLTDRALERILRAGVIPVAPIKNTDTIRLNHLCSVARTPTALHLGG